MLSFFIGMSEIVSAERCGSDLDEALGILATPCLGCFAVLAELVLDEVVRTIHADSLEAVWIQDGKVG